jgi:hypothetical protein
MPLDISFAAALQWIQVGQKVIQAGAPVLAEIKATMARHGIEADTSALDAVIVDAARRKAIAEAEAKG